MIDKSQPNKGFLLPLNRFNCEEDKIEKADVILPTGGDGTFLLAASRVRDNQKPVIGFNSDPSRSEGHLCLPKKYYTNIRAAVDRLQLVKYLRCTQKCALIKFIYRVTLSGY